MSQPPDLSADEALQRLTAGNGRLLEGRARSRGVLRETLAELTLGQHPIATGRVRLLAGE
jgi:hypothetical protein